MSKGLQIIRLTKLDLRIALQNNTYWNEANLIPFTKSKAFWLLDNHRMEDDDLCAVMAYEENEIVAFVFLIPDWIGEQLDIKKVYWCRRWWVADKHKNSILAAYVLSETMKATNNQVVLKFLGDNVEKFFEKQPFTKFSERTRYFMLFNMNTSLLTKKIKILRYFKPIIKIIDGISYKIIRARNNKITKTYTSELKYNYVSKIDNDIWSFLKSKLEKDIIPKSKEYINWQLSNNQSSQSIVSEKSRFTDLISGTLHQVYHMNFSIIHNNKIIGFVSALVRANEFYMKYFIVEDEYYERCVGALIENFNNTDTNTFYCEDEKLGEEIERRYTTVHVSKRRLYSMAHDDIDFNFESIKVQDQDANFA